MLESKFCDSHLYYFNGSQMKEIRQIRHQNVIAEGPSRDPHPQCGYDATGTKT